MSLFFQISKKCTTGVRLFCTIQKCHKAASVVVGGVSSSLDILWEKQFNYSDFYKSVNVEVITQWLTSSFCRLSRMRWDKWRQSLPSGRLKWKTIRVRMFTLWPLQLFTDNPCSDLFLHVSPYDYFSYARCHFSDCNILSSTVLIIYCSTKWIE